MVLCPLVCVLKKMAEKQTVTVTVDKNVAEASRPFLVNVCFVLF